MSRFVPSIIGFLHEKNLHLGRFTYVDILSTVDRWKVERRELRRTRWPWDTPGYRTLETSREALLQ